MYFPLKGRQEFNLKENSNVTLSKFDIIPYRFYILNKSI
jgi:hypothetical protein